MTTHKQPLVRRSGDQLITTSIDVSQHFGKKHQHILEAVRNLDCSPEFNASNFRPITYMDRRKRQKPAYEITRDGFSYLCMGFTGAAAAKWKEAYIRAFNAMEAELSRQNDVAHHIQQMQKELLTAKPFWRNVHRYVGMGLNNGEIGRLTNRNADTVRVARRRMEACGLLQPPVNLAAMQQMALRLTGGAA